MVAVCLVAGRADAIPLRSFGCITDNLSSDCAIGVAQLSGSVVASNGDALLTIQMSGTADGVVEQVFIESNIVSAISFSGSGGIVNFTGDGSPAGTLPGGTGVGFVTSVSASADNPQPRHGIGRHNQDATSLQFGIFLLTLLGGDFNDLLSDLRVGVHVIAFESDGSESFVTEPVPEPATFALVALGLVGLLVLSRRRSPPSALVPKSRMPGGPQHSSAAPRRARVAARQVARPELEGSADSRSHRRQDLPAVDLDRGAPSDRRDRTRAAGFSAHS